jgi:hypothetical protein
VTVLGVPSTFVRVCLTATVTVAVLLLAAGCGGGSSSSSSSGSSWEVLARSQLPSGTSLARADGIATEPEKLQMRVVASPKITTTVTYDVICGTTTLHGTASGSTTFVTPIPVPPGQGSQQAHGRVCDVHTTATRPTPTATTITVEMIPLPARPLINN